MIFSSQLVKTPVYKVRSDVKTIIYIRVETTSGTLLASRALPVTCK
jgi:hypothetical protein